jgi:hypothetical protein
MEREREVAVKVGRDAMRVMEDLKASQAMMGQSVLAGEALKAELELEVGGGLGAGPGAGWGWVLGVAGAGWLARW